MTLADIIQIIIGILTLIATVVVSVSIYWLQIRHEKEAQKLDLEHRSEQFLFDNEEERDYLPLCVFASNLHRHKKHIRKIYTNFCRCSEEMQNEILMQAGFSIRTITDTQWIGKSFELLNADIEKYKLGCNVLYDGAKYFHQGFENYLAEDWLDTYDKIFISFRKDTEKKVNIQYYFEDYFDCVLKKITEVATKPEPPIDYVCYGLDLPNASEKTVCYWVMVLVDEIVKNLYNRFIYNILDYKNKQKRSQYVWASVTEASIDTFEDKYYEIVMWLYYMYYVK